MSYYHVSKTPNGDALGRYTREGLAQGVAAGEIKKDWVATLDTGVPYQKTQRDWNATWVTIAELLANPLPTGSSTPPALESATGVTSPPLAAPPPVEFTVGNLLDVAKYQKANLWMILLSPFVGSSDPIVLLFAVVLSVVRIIYIYRLATALKSSPWMFMLLGFIPLLSLISLLVLNSRATSRLRAYGIGVGLMGARADDLERLKATYPNSHVLSTMLSPNAVQIERPASVRTGVTLLWIALGVAFLRPFVVSLVFMGFEFSLTLLSKISVVLMIIKLAIPAFLITQIYVGRSWARIVGLILAAYVIVEALPGMGTELKMLMSNNGTILLIAVLGVGKWILPIAGMICLFTPASSAWFKAQSSA